MRRNWSDPFERCCSGKWPTPTSFVVSTDGSFDFLEFWAGSFVLLMSQGIDGIQSGCAAGRGVTEQDADRCSKHEGDQVDLEVEVEWHLDDSRQTSAQTQRK